mgnify:CR=1
MGSIQGANVFIERAVNDQSPEKVVPIVLEDIPIELPIFQRARVIAQGS